MNPLPPRGGTRLLACLAVSCLGGCQDGADQATRSVVSQGSERVGGEIVSTVNGHAITVGQVRELARAGNVSPARALRLLQDEHVLMEEAARRGLAGREPVQQVGRRALVQALLDSNAVAVQVPQALMQERYAASGDRFSAPERRSSVHVLVPLSEDVTAEREAAARTLAVEMIGRLRDADDLDALIAELRGPEHPGDLKLVAQKLPAVDMASSFARPYLDAMFALAAPGVVPEPVRTRFGWHAIAVTAIEPARQVAFEQAEPELREELRLELQIGATRDLVERLRKDVPVVVSEGARDALSSVRL